MCKNQIKTEKLKGFLLFFEDDTSMGFQIEFNKWKYPPINLQNKTQKAKKIPKNPSNLGSQGFQKFNLTKESVKQTLWTEIKIKEIHTL